MNNQKVILITGCSSGFGFLTTVRLAAQGHFVWATMRDLSRKQPLEKELAKRQTQAFIRELDVTKPSTIKNVIEEIYKTHFHIDVLVNNAGFGTLGFFEDLSEEEIRAQMETNFFGVQNVCREVIPLMRERTQGKNHQYFQYLPARWPARPWARIAPVNGPWKPLAKAFIMSWAYSGSRLCSLNPGAYPTSIFTHNAYYAENMDNAQSPYFRYSQKIKSFLRDSIRKIDRDSDEVARLIENIINKPHPRLRYVSDLSSRLRMLAQKNCHPV